MYSLSDNTKTLWYTTPAGYWQLPSLTIDRNTAYWFQSDYKFTKLLYATLPSNKTTTLLRMKKKIFPSLSVLTMSNTTTIVTTEKVKTNRYLLIIKRYRYIENERQLVCKTKKMINTTINSLHLHDSHLYYTSAHINRVQVREVYRNCSLGREVLFTEYPTSKVTSSICMTFWWKHLNVSFISTFIFV